MSGECDKCGEHCLDCVCNSNITAGERITLNEPIRVTFNQPIRISINIEYLKDKFEEVFSKWDQKLWHGIDKEDQKLLIYDLLINLNKKRNINER